MLAFNLMHVLLH